MPSEIYAEPAATEATKKLLPWIVAIAFFMESLDTTILNTAVPTIAQALSVAPLSLKSVLASYTLSLAVFIPISGWMADRFGTRMVFSTAIGVFTLGSLLCGVSTSLPMLVLFRIVQGFGGAMMVPVGRLSIVRTFAKSELVRAMAFVAIPALIGPLLGPLAGGLLVHYSHWRTIFFVNVPIGILGMILVRKYLPDYREPRTTPLDTVGLILFGSGTALLSYVLEVFGEHTLRMREIVGLFAVALALLLAYWMHAWRIPAPLLNLSLLRIRTFRAAVGGGLLTRLGVGGIPFLLPMLYQVGLGYTPVQSGLLMMPQAVAAMSLRLLIPKILARLGYRAVLVSNTIALGLVIMMFTWIGPATPYWLIVVLGVCYGFVSSTQYTSMNSLVYADVGPHDSSAASSIASTFQQLAVSFGIATASLLTALFLPDRFHSTSAEIVKGIRAAFLAMGGLTIATTVVFAGLRGSDGAAVSSHMEE